MSEPRLPLGVTPRLLSREQAAAYLGISVNHFDRHCTQVPVIELGQRRLYDIRVLDAFIDAQVGNREYNPIDPDKLLEAFDEQPKDQGNQGTKG
jgi:hypothetical protein